MIKYGLIVCLIASSSLFGMEVREDLKGLTYEQLRERERINKEADKAFKANYASDAWRFDDNIKKERDAIFEEQRALQTAILFGGHVSRESFKAHAITDSRRVEATATDV